MASPNKFNPWRVQQHCFMLLFPPSTCLCFYWKESRHHYKEIFSDALDVKENLRLLGKVLDHGCANENGEELDRVEMHETGEKFPWQLALSFDIQKEDQPRDEEAEIFISAL